MKLLEILYEPFWGIPKATLGHWRESYLASEELRLLSSWDEHEHWLGPGLWPPPWSPLSPLSPWWPESELFRLWSDLVPLSPLDNELKILQWWWEHVLTHGSLDWRHFIGTIVIATGGNVKKLFWLTRLVCCVDWSVSRVSIVRAGDNNEANHNYTHYTTQTFQHCFWWMASTCRMFSLD